MNNDLYLVTINVPPTIEGGVVDSLLMLESERSFSSFLVSSHHHKNHGLLSKSEQVTGRQREIRFQIYVPKDKLPELLEQLRQDFSGLGIQYWVIPVIEYGII